MKDELAAASQAALQAMERDDTYDMWSKVGVLELARVLDQLDPKDADKVEHSMLIEGEAEARAAMLVAEEYARVELAKLVPAVTWFIQRLAQTPEDRGVLAALMRFVDRHHVTELVGSCGAPEGLLAPKLTDAGARERVYTRLRDEGFSNRVIAAAMGESPSAQRERRRSRKARGRK